MNIRFESLRRICSSNILIPSDKAEWTVVERQSERERPAVTVDVFISVENWSKKPSIDWIGWIPKELCSVYRTRVISRRWCTTFYINYQQFTFTLHLFLPRRSCPVWSFHILCFIRCCWAIPWETLLASYFRNHLITSPSRRSFQVYSVQFRAVWIVFQLRVYDGCVVLGIAFDGCVFLINGWFKCFTAIDFVASNFQNNLKVLGVIGKRRTRVFKKKLFLLIFRQLF